MNKGIDEQRGFALIAIMIAVLIIAVIAFGFMNQKGQVQQSQEIKNKAAEDLKSINDNLKKNNQEIQNELGINEPVGLIKNDTNNYKKYSNGKIGYEISFPSHWTLDSAATDYFQIYSDYGGIDIQPDDNRMKITGVIFTNTEKNIDEAINKITSGNKILNKEEIKLGNKVFKKILVEYVEYKVERSYRYYYEEANRIIQFSYLPFNSTNIHIDEFYKIIQSFNFLPIN